MLVALVKPKRLSARRVRRVRASCTRCNAVSSSGFPARNLGDRVEERCSTCDDVPVPLSEDEQRILRQIEEELEQDPTFAQRGYRVSRRRSALLVVGLVVGLAVTVACLAVNFVAAFVAFLFVVLMAVKLESEVRLLGREQLGQLPISAWLHARRPAEQSDIVD